MTKKYFGTDGIRGKVNQTKINGEMFFKFGLAAGTYFKNQKKSKQTAIIAKEWITNLKRLIFDGPKYLKPLFELISW